MDELSISGAHESDIPEIAEILTEATKYKLSHDDLVWGNTSWSNEEVRNQLSDSTVYLIQQGKEIIGTFSLQWEDERNWGPQPPVAGYLHRLAIRDGHHGQGLGRQVVDWAIAQTTEKGRQFLRLDCEEKNTELCEYYESLGFKKVGTSFATENKEYLAALYERSVST